MYALIALLDNDTVKTIQNVWRGLSEADLSNYAYEVKDREPHVTLASFDTDDIDGVVEVLRLFLADYSPLSLTFNHLSSFTGARMVTFNPVKTLELSQFHHQLHYRLKDKIREETQYAPQSWVPHLTLANRIPEDKIAHAFKYCLEKCPMLHGHIVAVQLIKIGSANQVSPLMTQRL